MCGAQRQLCEVSSLLPHFCGFQELNKGHQSCEASTFTCRAILSVLSAVFTREEMKKQSHLSPINKGSPYFVLLRKPNKAHFPPLDSKVRIT